MEKKHVAPPAEREQTVPTTQKAYLTERNAYFHRISSTADEILSVIVKNHHSIGDMEQIFLSVKAKVESMPIQLL